MRLGGYSAAARSLNVTHAAIAQHIRALETHFGRPLMQREGNGMRPTDAGEQLAAALSTAFGEIAKGVHALMQDGAEGPLRVATTHSFAENWLVPRIGGFWSAFPGIALELIPSPDLVDLRRDGIDIAIRYGRGDWRGLETEPLVSAALTVVAAPGLIDPDTAKEIRMLEKCHWFFVGFRDEDRLWLSAQGIDVEALKATHFDTGGLVMQAVRAGHGLAVQPQALVERDLAQGSLVSLFEEEASPLAYHIATLPGIRPKRTGTFIRWLKAQR